MARIPKDHTYEARCRRVALGERGDADGDGTDHRPGSNPPDAHHMPLRPPMPLRVPEGVGLPAPHPAWSKGARWSGPPAVLRRLRLAGADPRAFRRPPLWLGVGLGLLVASAFLPLLLPESRALTERMNPLLSLVFLLTAVGLWLGLGNRSLEVASVLALALYGLTAWTRLAFDVHDLYVLALLVGFLVYALAGFNLVFVLEEAVYDAHRLLHLRHPLWRAAPFVGVGALAIGLPLLDAALDVPLPTLWVTSLVCVALLGGWWFVRLVNGFQEGVVLRELHLLVAGALAAAGLVEAFRLVDPAGVLASVAAYVALLGTWLFVSYTTLQRTHFLLRGRNARPWLAILLAASFAVLGHAQLNYNVGGASALHRLLDQRIGYVVAGIGLGMVFFAARSFWRLAQYLRDDGRLGAGTRITFGRVARVVESLFETEERLGRAALRFYRNLEVALPGHVDVEWELDAEGGPVRKISRPRH